MIIEMSKGYQITIPAKIRNELGWKPGTKLEIEESKAGILIAAIHAKEPAGKHGWEDIFEQAKKHRTNLTPQQLDELMQED